MTDGYMASQEEGRSKQLDSSYAWCRLIASLVIGTVGGIGMWSSVVLLPEIQAHFGVDRSDASLPYTVAMIGIMVGNVVMGRMVDKFGVVVPTLVSALCLGLGFAGAAFSSNFLHFPVTVFFSHESLKVWLDFSFFSVSLQNASKSMKFSTEVEGEMAPAENGHLVQRLLCQRSESGWNLVGIWLECCWKLTQLWTILRLFNIRIDSSLAQQGSSDGLRGLDIHENVSLFI